MDILSSDMPEQVESPELQLSPGRGSSFLPYHRGHTRIWVIGKPQQLPLFRGNDFPVLSAVAGRVHRGDVVKDLLSPHRHMYLMDTVWMVDGLKFLG